MNDGRKDVPFALDDEEDDEVFSSVEVQRAGEARAAATPGRSGPLSAPPISRSGALVAPRVAHPRLIVENSGQSGSRTVDITSPTFTIGGASEADLELPDDYASDFHAQIRIDGTRTVLQDLGSQNGVYLRIADDLPLEDFDEIITGMQHFVFRTTWDTPPPPRNPHRQPAPTLGANPPRDAARLIQIFAGGQVGGVWRLASRLTIGRQHADVVEPDDPWLSAPHATIERRADKFFIKDTQSQYGTFIRLLDAVELIDGDVFMVGRSRITIHFP